MATRSNIRVILKEEDRNRDMKFNPEMIEIKNTWGKGQQLETGLWETVNPDGHDTLIVYHHWDGYPEGIGQALLEDYNDYDKALNLVLGGDISSAVGDYSPYALREGESWDGIKPQAVNFDERQHNEYDYMFFKDKWFVRDCYSEEIKDWTPLEEYLETL